MNHADLPAPEDFPGHWLPFADALKQTSPLGLTPISAGLPSPAEDYADRRLDINDYLVRNPVSTFFFHVQGESVQRAEVFHGRILVVDRSITPRHGHIVVELLNPGGAKRRTIWFGS
ncbi:S24 family peptidase [Zoogloea sp.]|uniref:LexA family protein n=1 Tax=Zoogloea sp. TaxID=49181 RepID=UPI0031FCA224